MLPTRNWKPFYRDNFKFGCESGNDNIPEMCSKKQLEKSLNQVMYREQEKNLPSPNNCEGNTANAETRMGQR